MTNKQQREYDRGQLDYDDNYYSPPLDEELAIYYQRGWNLASSEQFLDRHGETYEPVWTKVIRPYHQFFADIQNDS